MTETTTDIWIDTSEVMQRLTGSWSFDRVIEGHGTMQGTATFSPLDRERLAYYEQGNLKLLNGLFHEISLTARSGGGLSGDAGHLCNLDDYQSTYTFLPDGKFVIRHVVSGPRKDYTLTTTYSRI